MVQRKRKVVRLSIPMDEQVLDVFRGMAAAARIPVGRCIAEWCADTVDGAQFVAKKMEEARKSPMLVMREVQSGASGFLREVTEQMDKMRKAVPVDRTQSGRPGRPKS